MALLKESPLLTKRYKSELTENVKVNQNNLVYINRKKITSPSGNVIRILHYQRQVYKFKILNDTLHMGISLELR